jgi:hypothetical protein
VRAYFYVLVGGTLAGAVLWKLSGIGGSHPGSIIGISAGVYAMMLVALLDKLDHQITLLLFFFLPVTLKVRWMLLLTALFTLLGWIFAELPGRHDWTKWHAAWTDSIAHSAHPGALLAGRGVDGAHQDAIGGIAHRLHHLGAHPTQGAGHHHRQRGGGGSGGKG